MKTKKWRIYLLIIVLSILNSFITLAAEAPVTVKDVIFVLDASGSMKANDPGRLAIDSIAQLIYTLPSDYRTGFIAYNTELVFCQEPVASEEREQIMAQAEAVTYADYTNAGAGLYGAVELLGDSPAIEKHIVLLSDGEILMGSESDTAQSAEAYRNAITQAAQNGIRIHVIGLGTEMADQDNSIFAAALETGGGSYYTPQAVGIQQAIDAILDTQLQIKRIAAAIVDQDSGLESLSIDLPFTHAGKVRVLLTSNGAIRNLNTNFQADNAKQINGERYSLIEIDRPKSDRMDISFSGTAGNRVSITVIPEYHVVAKAEVTKYEDSIPLVEDAIYYEREATVSYTFFDADNESIQLWTEDYFNHNLILLTSGIGSVNAALTQGSLQISEMITDDHVVHAYLDYADFSANIIGGTEAEVVLEGPPALPVEEPETEPPYLLILFSCLLVAGIIVLIWLARKNTQDQIPPLDDRPEPGKSSYVGRLNLYITRTISGYDIPPLSFDLFRFPQSRVISIAEVLESCGVSETFRGADRIYIKSGQKRSIILTNNSDCTLMKSGEILMKRKSYSLSSNAKVDIMFEDEISEMTFQYKDLRPSEMR